MFKRITKHQRRREDALELGLDGLLQETDSDESLDDDDDDDEDGGESGAGDSGNGSDVDSNAADPGADELGSYATDEVTDGDEHDYDENEDAAASPRLKPSSLLAFKKRNRAAHGDAPPAASRQLDTPDDDEEGGEGEDDDGEEDRNGPPPMDALAATTDPIYPVPASAPDTTLCACVVCPGKLLKNVHMVSLHAQSTAHLRRLRRYTKYVKTLGRELDTDDPRAILRDMGQAARGGGGTVGKSPTSPRDVTSKRAQRRDAWKAKRKERAAKKQAANAAAAAATAGAAPAEEALAESSEKVKNASSSSSAAQKKGRSAKKKKAGGRSEADDNDSGADADANAEAARRRKAHVHKAGDETETRIGERSKAPYRPSLEAVTSASAQKTKRAHKRSAPDDDVAASRTKQDKPTKRQKRGHDGEGDSSIRPNTTASDVNTDETRVTQAAPVLLHKDGGPRKRSAEEPEHASKKSSKRDDDRPKKKRRKQQKDENAFPSAPASTTAPTTSTPLALKDVGADGGKSKGRGQVQDAIPPPHSRKKAAATATAATGKKEVAQPQRGGAVDLPDENAQRGSGLVRHSTSLYFADDEGGGAEAEGALQGAVRGVVVDDVVPGAKNDKKKEKRKKQPQQQQQRDKVKVKKGNGAGGDRV